MLGNEVPGSCKVAGAMWVSVGPRRGHFTIQQILVPILKFRNWPADILVIPLQMPPVSPKPAAPRHDCVITFFWATALSGYCSDRPIKFFGHVAMLEPEAVESWGSSVPIVEDTKSWRAIPNHVTALYRRHAPLRAIRLTFERFQLQNMSGPDLLPSSHNLQI